MGLDMYLNRIPRYKEATAADVDAVESYLGWQEEKARGSEYAQCTFAEWCGRTEVPSKESILVLGAYYDTKYPYWDAEKRYGRNRIMEMIGYWRKANAIHKWFVDNVQDGIDDCDYHREVTKEDLEELRDVCHEVLCNPDLANKLLPTRGGFFFGSLGYDEWYIEGLEDTIEICDQALATTDFEKQMIYYCSSW